MSHHLKIVPRVDHRDPIHDGFCRCPVCRPSRNQPARDRRLLAAIIVGAPVGLILWGLAWATLRLAGTL